MAFAHSRAYREDGNCYTLEPIPTCPSGELKLLHLGYSSPTAESRIIIPFTQFDLVPESNPAQYGVHYGTLMFICYIITGNKLGFLSPAKLPESASVPLAIPEDCARGFDDVLTGESYYYYILGIPVNETYRILDDLDSWSFPRLSELRGNPLWSNWESVFNGETRRVMGATDVSVQVKMRDTVCQVTGTRGHLGCQAAHIIPSAEGNWFLKNDLSAFSRDILTDLNPTNRPSNMFLMRSDLHFIFNQRFFAFVPKGEHLVAHFFNHTQSAPACFPIHNAGFRHPGCLSAHYFLARLAWTVLPWMDQFNAGIGSDPKRKRRAHNVMSI
ncbi:hypothetical protein BDV93DRAFT_354923 [Ceratobasidium sp. AG-I]|nr:hypothetical protein BDV93DRAFT_354923 [Ceratobasidium sp. AG-I]